MKRASLFTLLATLCLVLVLTALPAKADSQSKDAAVLWELNEETGVLRISGQGEVKSGYQIDHTYRRKVRTLILEEGITEIASNTFQSFDNLTSVQFPSTLTKIGNWAFSSCDSLKSIHIPDTVTTIGCSAFANCTSLEEVTLPNTLTRLLGNTFFSCIKLKSIRIPDSITEFYADAFALCPSLKEIHLGANVSKIALGEQCGLSTVHISQDNPYYMSDQGVVYTKDGKNLVWMPSGFSEEYTILPGTTTINEFSCHGVNAPTIVIPDTVTQIGKGAFRYAQITSITIPGSVTRIDHQTFEHCKLLTTVILCEGVSQLGNAAFSGSGINSIILPSTLTEIERSVFSTCYKLESVVFTGNAPKIDPQAFFSTTTTIYFPDDLPSWNTMLKMYSGRLTWVPASSTTPTTIPAAPPATGPGTVPTASQATEPGTTPTTPSTSTDPVEPQTSNAVIITVTVVAALAVCMGIVLLLFKKKK